MKKCLIILLFLNLYCSQTDTPPKYLDKILFKEIPSSVSNIRFNNYIKEDQRINVYNYLNVYNGAGVAVGDINNDGLCDIFFTGNQVKDRLYLNKGNFEFLDITNEAGIKQMTHWSTGVSMIDINADGFLDIYICRAFDEPGKSKNALFINNGDLSFSERAEEFGIADDSWSTQASFLDFDLDGDLDLFVANHFKQNKLSHEYSLDHYLNPTMELSNHFYINQGNNRFIESSKKVGIFDYGLSLGVLSTDFNGDGYPDIYVANDQQEPDHFYINQKNGTFQNEIQERTKHTSYFSMGIDAADVNNDGLSDMMIVDMMAADNFRQKAQMPSMDPNLFWTLVDDNYHYQYMRNVLQKNNGDGSYSDIGYMSGMANTDWSWAPLIIDFDNDGLKDIFITNGIKKDILDKDYINKVNEIIREDGGYYQGDFNLLTNLIPSTPIRNKMYKNNGKYSFTDVSISSNFTEGFSNGASYADLDNDGDLDLIINNVNAQASILENISEGNNNFIKLKLEGKSPNLNAIGARVYSYADSLVQLHEVQNVRGYKSSVDLILNIGLGQRNTIDSIKVIWPDREVKKYSNLSLNHTHIIVQNEGRLSNFNPPKNKLVQELPSSKKYNIKHIENKFDDFEKQVLLPHKLSQFGPALATGDVDGNGRNDFYIGGAKGQNGNLYLNMGPSEYKKLAGPWSQDKSFEDIDASFFDADNDGDLDLYVVSGGNEFAKDSPALVDRIYLNENKKGFIKAEGILPSILASGSCVKPADFDNDGDIDLFIGARLVPGEYPLAPPSYLLQNENGKFTNISETYFPALKQVGMVTDAYWSDINQDSHLDLIVVGEWMKTRVFINTGGEFVDKTESLGLGETTGWWNSIQGSDFDDDGDEDFIVGNLGENYKYQASESKPFHLFSHDFDNNGSLDIVLGYNHEDRIYPVRGRECSSEQIPFIKDKFADYRSFASATLPQIYSQDGIEKSIHLEIKNFSSVYLENVSGKFIIHNLPIDAQIFPIQDILLEDINQDKKMDVILVGNFYVSEIETGRADAGTGLILMNNMPHGFHTKTSFESGFYAKKDARKIKKLSSQSEKNSVFLVANNNDMLQFFSLKSKE